MVYYKDNATIRDAKMKEMNFFSEDDHLLRLCETGDKLV